MELRRGSDIRRAPFLRAPSPLSRAATPLARDVQSPVFAYLRPDSARHTACVHAIPLSVSASPWKFSPVSRVAVDYFSTPRRATPGPWHTKSAVAHPA